MYRRYLLSVCIIPLLLLLAPLLSRVEAGVEGETAYLVLLDQSSSMWLADPGGRRIAIVKALIDLIPDGARLQLVEFASEAKAIFPEWLVIDDPKREKVKALLEGRSLSSRDATDISAALAKGLELISELEPGLQPVVLLISDGRVTVGSREALLNTLAIYAVEQIPVYTFGLGPFQPALLRTISERAGTGGQYTNASRPWLAVKKALGVIIARYSPPVPVEGPDQEKEREELQPRPLKLELDLELERVLQGMELALSFPSQIWEDDPLVLKATVLYSGRPLGPGSTLRIEMPDRERTRKEVEEVEVEVELEVEELQVKASIIPEGGGEGQGLVLILSFNPALKAYQGELRGLKPGEHWIRAIAWGVLRPILPEGSDQRERARFELSSPEGTLIVQATPLVGLRFRPPKAVFIRNQPILIELIGIGPDGPYELSSPPQEVELEVEVEVEVEGPTPPHSSRTITLSHGEGIARFPEGDYKITLLPGRHYKVGPEASLSFRVVPPTLSIEPQELLFAGRDSPRKLSLHSTLYPPDIAALKVEIEAGKESITIEPNELTLSPDRPEAELLLRRARTGATFSPWERLARRERTFKVIITDINDVYPWETQEVALRMAPPLPWPETFAGLALLTGLWVLMTGLRRRGRLREGEEIPLEKERIVVGSGPDCDLLIANPNISAKHFAVELERAPIPSPGPTPAPSSGSSPGEEATLTLVRDLGGGVRILRDGELHKVISQERLQPGDVIVIGGEGTRSQSRSQSRFQFQFRVSSEGRPSLRVKGVSYLPDRLGLKLLAFLGLSAIAVALYLI